MPGIQYDPMQLKEKRQVAEVEDLSVSDSEDLREREEVDQLSDQTGRDRQKEPARFVLGQQRLRDVAGHKARG